MEELITVNSDSKFTGGSRAGIASTFRTAGLLMDASERRFEDRRRIGVCPRTGSGIRRKYMLRFNEID